MAEVAEVEYEIGLTVVRMPYDADLIARLKDELPSWARVWDRNRRVWKISAEYWDDAAKIIEDRFPIVG